MAGVQELRVIVEGHKSALDRGLFNILREGKPFVQVGLERQAEKKTDTSSSTSPRLRCAMDGCSRMRAVGYSVCLHGLHSQFAHHFAQRGFFLAMVPPKHTDA
eukprot:4936688-Karenia_brevis.AAC.1